MTSTIMMYTDGACRGNPGPGGWAAVLRSEKQERRLSGYVSHTTNNRMELMAVIEGLAAIETDHHTIIFTDSQYVKKGIQLWSKKWERNGWKTASGGAVKNKELWVQLRELTQRDGIEWRWVRGHTGDEFNELADGLAGRAIDRRCTDDVVFELRSRDQASNQ